MKIELKITDEFEGNRLDIFLAERLDGYSRSEIAQIIKKGDIAVSGKSRKPSYRVHSSEIISVFLPDEKKNTILIQNDQLSSGYSDPIRNESDTLSSVSASKRDLDIIYEDLHVIVLNKASGVVVHPAPGNHTGTLVHSLIKHYPPLSGVGEDVLRPGIVHRLDRDTSGVIVVAKNNESFKFLKKEFMQRRVEKRYIALVAGNVREDRGEIAFPIGRHPVKRKMMSTSSTNQRYALTLWKVIKRYEGAATLVEAELKTGRTHQVRVHFKALGHPLIGDTVYGPKKAALVNYKALNLLDPDISGYIKNCSRQSLHAMMLSFRHPWSGRRVTFIAPLPEDMAVFKGFVCVD